MIKSGNRSQSTINRHSDESNSGDHWLKEFQNKLQIVAVQPRGKDLYEQITSIMNTKSKYTSVQQAVVSMMERSGLQTYLNQTSADEKKQYHKKLAQQIQQSSQHATSIEPPDGKPKVDDKNTPDIIKEKPDVLKTLENIIQDTRGNISLPAIINRLRSLHARDVSDEAAWDDEKLMRLVSQLNLQAKRDNPGNFENYDTLGQGDHSTANSELDQSNSDAWAGLMPAKLQ